MSFNPITNQPLMDYKSQQNKIEKPQEIKDFNNEKQKFEYNNDRFQQINRNQREPIPMGYNPYKQPYSIYQGHP